MNNDTYDSNLSSFYKMLQEALKDGEPNDVCQELMDRRPDEKHLFETEFYLNHDLLLLFIEYALIPSENRINAEALNIRAQLMQKLIIQDDYHLLSFLARTIMILHEKHFPLNEIDKAISILHSQKVIPSFIKNHWTFAKRSDGQSSETMDRWNAIRNCLVFKLNMSRNPHGESDDDDDEE